MRILSIILDNEATLKSTEKGCFLQKQPSYLALIAEKGSDLWEEILCTGKKWYRFVCMTSHINKLKSNVSFI